MFSGTASQLILAAAVLGPISHYVIWSRVSVDTQSHKLLLAANLIVLFGPLVLWTHGIPLLFAAVLSAAIDTCYGLTLLTSIAVYRGFLHPLRSFPGPFWAKLSVFWKVKQFQTSDARAYKVVDELHQEYGDVVRISPRQLSINDPTAYHVIYGSGSECRRLESLEKVRKNLQSLSSPDEHRARRKIWDHGLSVKACLSYLPRVNDITNRFCHSLSLRQGSPIVINEWCHFFTFDVMGDVGFGRSYGQIESGKVHPAVLKVHEFLKAGVIAIQMIWAVNFLKLIPGLDDPMRDLKEWAEQLLRERAQMKDFEKTSANTKDLMSYVEESQKALEPQWRTSDDDLAEDAVTLQIAGSDTSYSAIANSFHYLANYPDLQYRVREEVLLAFDGVDTEAAPAWAKLSSDSSCPYLDAMVKEVLRCHPPVPQGTLRETPNHPMTIAGHIIPPKTLISCPIWTIQHDERHFGRPESFIPERWLDHTHPSSRADLTFNKRAFVPFSVGPMNCAGKYFAYMEIKVLLAKVLQRFHIAFDASEDGCTKDEKNLQQARDEDLAYGLKDYLTQVVGTPIKICFIER